MKIKTRDKNTRIRYETYLKFKLENRNWCNIVKRSSVVFIVTFERTSYLVNVS